MPSRQGNFGVAGYILYSLREGAFVIEEHVLRLIAKLSWRSCVLLLNFNQ